MPTSHPGLLSLLPLLCALVLAGCTGGGDRDRAELEATAREHAHDTPAANASAAEPAQEVTARMVTYGTVDGQSVSGYLARPAQAGGEAIPGVVMIHEWWGLNDNVRMMARRLAGEGYAVLAVDLYGGKTAQTPEEARQLVTQVMQAPAPATGNLQAAAAYLATQERAPRVGILGWCFGGGWSLRGALAMPERIDAAVMYYGQPITDPAQLTKLRAPLLGFFGGADQSIPLEQVREMETKLRELGKEVTIQVYPGAGHAFANPSGTTYQPEAASDSWERTLAFLARTLKPAAP